MRGLVALVLVLSLGRAQTASTAEHLISPVGVQERLAEVARDRAQRIAVVETLLDTPEAAHAGELSGISIERVRRQVALLSDAELREVALRAEALRSDPISGNGGAEQALAALLLLVLVGFVLAWVATLLPAGELL